MKFFTLGLLSVAAAKKKLNFSGKNAAPAENAAVAKVDPTALVAPAQGDLFGCSDYDSCAAANVDETLFNKMMIFTGVQFAKYAYKVSETDKENPASVFDDKSYIEDLLLNDQIYGLFDNPYNAKDWLQIESSEGFFLKHPGGRKAQVLGYSGYMSLRTVDQELKDPNPAVAEKKPVEEEAKPVEEEKKEEESCWIWCRKRRSAENDRRNVIFVNFRGTATKSDAKDDVDIGIEKDVYTGFYRRSQVHAVTLLKRLLALYKESKAVDVLFGGHSLGGADAMIAPVILKRVVAKPSKEFFEAFPNEEDQMQIIDLVNSVFKFHTITIGAPRPGSPIFAQEFKNVVTYHKRLENWGDAVPKNPSQKAEALWQNKAIRGLVQLGIELGFESRFAHVDTSQVLNDDLGELGSWPKKPSQYHSSDRYEALWRQQVRIFANDKQIFHLPTEAPSWFNWGK